MIKNIALLLIFICFYHIAPAEEGGPGGICNLFDADSDRYETWNGTTYYRGKNDHLCPPYNRDGGRHNNTCLVREVDPKLTKDEADIPAPGLPASFSAYYENLCGEESPDSTYFEPKIRVRGQQCNGLFCWHTDSTLDWDGECVTLPGGYLFPFHRMCARVALPEDTIRDIPVDPGYTKGRHLNNEGALEDDDPIYDKNGNLLTFDSPKLCLYYDPAFLDFKDINRPDLFDVDPSKQPFHKTSERHPVVQVIIFIIETLNKMRTFSFDLFNQLLGVMGGFGEFFQIFIDAIIWLIELQGMIIIEILKEIGQINSVVHDKAYGCVNLPLGPMPPPYCEEATPVFQDAVTYNICPKDSNGDLIESTREKPCVVSTMPNNFVHNSVRVGYETLVPLCRNNENPMTTDTCVVIENIEGISSASTLHAAGAYRDIIKHCDDVASGTVCIKTMLPNTCSVTENGCNNGFRVVYSENIGDRSTPKKYFSHDLEDCPSSNSATCQAIWGVNMGEFIDVSISFPSIQAPNDTSPLVKDFQLTDKSARVANFYSSIIRIPPFDNPEQFLQNPNQICVFEGDFVVGCNDRVPPSGVKISSCEDSSNINCINNSYFTPEFIVSYIENGYSTSALIKPLSEHNQNDTTHSDVNLAGVEFESFVTDDSFITKPFLGSKSTNPSSILGTYQDNILPTESENAVYLKDLEYKNGNYNLGGKHACLTNINSVKCPENMKLCVLSNLLNRDIVKCSEFFKKVSQYRGIGICSTAQSSSCPALDSLSKIDGTPMIIRDCGNQGKCYDSDVELCQVSYDPKDRYIPGPDEDILSNYYSIPVSAAYPGAPVIETPDYDTDKYGMRSKTSIELGLCADVPQGKCTAEEDYSEDNGYASWPETASGEQATGTCKPGWREVQPLKRYCVPFVNGNDKGFRFEPLYRKDDGSNVRKYTDIKCIEDEEEKNQ